MEAAVAEKEEAGMTEWNDGRLDDLSKRVDRIEYKMDQGFAHVDQRFKEADRKMDAGFARIEGKFDELHRMLFKAAWALVIGLLGLLGVIVAQL